MKIKDRLKPINISWYFLVAVIFVYIMLAFIDFSLFSSSLKFFSNLVIKIIPFFILIFILMAITNYFITPELITKHFKESGIKKWIFVVIGGILSAGPIYMWYPLLAELKEKGVNYGFIATFLYSRAIKIPLLPVIIFYFSLKYVIVLTGVMIVISIVQGITVNKILPLKKE